MKIEASTDCPCTADCERHSNCVACVKNHRGKNLPVCLRTGKNPPSEEKK